MRLVVFLPLICLAMTGFARGAIVYTLVGQVAGPHTAVGTITTDGTLGSLSAANVLSSTITVSDAANSFLLLPAPVSFTGVTATDSLLSFDGTGGNEVYFTIGSDLTHWRLRSNLLRTIRTQTSGGQRGDITFPHVFASGGTAVPEPNVIVSLAVVSGVLALRRRRRALCA